MSKRYVLSGYFGFKNFGDEAILSLLVKKIQENKNLITIISSNPQYTKKQYRHVKSVHTFNFRDIIATISKSDILVSGGGSLLQDVTSLKSLIYYLLIILTGLIFKKKVIIFAQGIGPINNPFGRYLTKNILKYCSYISVRDKKSYELLENWGIKSDLLCDPVFSIETPAYEKQDVVAVQLRNFKTLTQDFIDRLAQSVVNNFSDKTVEIYSFQDDIDLEICKNFENNLKMLNPEIKTKLFYNLTNKEIIDNLAKSQYLIGMRFHAIIIGLITGTKVLSINYDTKVEKISKEFGLPMLDLRKDFTNQFEQLKKQNTDTNLDIVKTKKFDWTNFSNM